MPPRTVENAYGTTRRNLLAIGAAALVEFGIGSNVIQVRADVQQNLADRMQKRPNTKPLPVIGICFDGGLSSAESFDAKPNAHYAHQSGLQCTRTENGLYVSNVFPELRKLATRLTVVRTLRSPDITHRTNSEYLLKDGRSNFHQILGRRSKTLPYVYVESNFDGFGDAQVDEPNSVVDVNDKSHQVYSALSPSWNGKRYKPFLPRRDENLPTRVGILNKLDRFKTTSQRMRDYQTHVNTAVDLLLGKPPKAFEEPSPAALKRYGDNQFGRAAYIVGRLINDGAPSVMLRHGHWDMHRDIAACMKKSAPKADRAIAALFRDMENGVVKEAVVWGAGEVGREAKINNLGGRHHDDIHSGFFYGGDFKPGYVHGTTDREWRPTEEEFVVDTTNIKHLAVRGARQKPLDSDIEEMHTELFVQR